MSKPRSAIAAIPAPAADAAPLRTPPDLTGHWAETFQNVCDVVEAQQAGLMPADLDMIAAYVRNLRSEATHRRLAREALEEGDTAAFLKFEAGAEKQAAGARAAARTLRVSPENRSGRAAREAAPHRLDAVDGGKTWEGDLA